MIFYNDGHKRSLQQRIINQHQTQHIQSGRYESTDAPGEAQTYPLPYQMVGACSVAHGKLSRSETHLGSV